MSKLQIKRGNKVNLPTLADGELGYCRDTKELFIGNGTGNDFVTGNLNPDNLTKVVGIAKGGTGAATAQAALTNLGAISKQAIVNNVTTTAAGNVLDARQGKVLQDAIAAHTSNKSNPHGVTRAQVGLGSVDNVADISKPVSTAQQTAIDKSYQQATGYTDNKIAALINGAPSTLDTLKEVADAIAENESVVDALDKAIGTKASTADFDGHRNNSTIHVTQTDKNNLATALTHAQSTHVTAVKGSAESTYRTGQVNITAANVGLGNVPNVSTNDHTPTYTEASALTELTSGEKLSVAFGKIKLAVKNVKSLVSLLGNTDISAIGNGTVTGALTTLNSNIVNITTQKLKEIPNVSFVRFGATMLSGSMSDSVKIKAKTYLTCYLCFETTKAPEKFFIISFGDTNSAHYFWQTELRSNYLHFLFFNPKDTDATFYPADYYVTYLS